MKTVRGLACECDRAALGVLVAQGVFDLVDALAGLDGGRAGHGTDDGLLAGRLGGAARLGGGRWLGRLHGAQSSGFAGAFPFGRTVEEHGLRGVLFALGTSKRSTWLRGIMKIVFHACHHKYMFLLVKM